MTVRIDVTGHVGEIVFANPPLNFATIALLRGIANALDALGADTDVRAIVLASEGQTFCAGADLVSEDGFGAATADPIRELYDQAERIFAAPKPIVAAVHGAAVGAGLGLAVAADFRVAAPVARFAANFVALGFHPGFALTATLPRLIGAQRAAEMFLTARRYRTDEVVAWGLVDRVAEEPRAAARTLATEIAANAPLALLATRATLRAGLAEAARRALAHEHAEQSRLRGTADHAEGVRATAERRPGRFTGR